MLNSKRFSFLKKILNDKNLILDFCFSFKKQEVINLYYIIEYFKMKELSHEDLLMIFEYFDNINANKLIKLIDEIKNVLKLEKNPESIAFEQLQNSQFKIYFYQKNDATAINSINAINEHYKFNLDKNIVITNQETHLCYGFTIDLNNYSLDNVKLYFNVKNKLNKEEIGIPYITMYSLKDNIAGKKYDYFYCNDSNRLYYYQLLKRKFNISINNYIKLIPENYKLSEIQYSNIDDKINIYFFDKID